MRRKIIVRVEVRNIALTRLAPLYMCQWQAEHNDFLWRGVAKDCQSTGLLVTA